MFGFANNANANAIYSLEVPGRPGVIGMSACPGIRLESLKRGNIARNMKRDIAAYQEWGASGVVTLNQPEELQEVGVVDLESQIYEAGMWWRQMPIVDMNVPSTDFEVQWKADGQQIKGSLAAGERVILHCLAGLGRTGMIAARILVECGMSPEYAIAEVRKIRPRAIQTQQQEDYVRSMAKKTRHDRWSRLQGSGQKIAAKGEQQIKGFGT